MDFSNYIMPTAILGVIFYQFVLAGKIPKTRTYNRLFSEAAEKYHCTFAKGNIISSPKISGTIDEAKISVERTGSTQEEFLRIVLTFNSHLPGNFIIQKETNLSNLKRSFGDKDIQVGDKDLDKALLISASHPSIIAALFNKTELKKIKQLNAESNGFVIEENRISTRSRLNTYMTTEYVTNRIDLVLSIAKNIRSKQSIKTRILKNIQSETKAAIITNNIKALMSHHSIDKEIENVLREALNNRSIAVQTAAAEHLGGTGMKHICTLLKEKPNLKHSEKIQIVNILIENKYSKSIPRLKQLYLKSKNLSLQLLILTAFREYADQSAESFLIKELKNSDTALCYGAIKALGACGTAISAEKLYHLANNSTNPDIKKYARMAIAQIQSRLGTVKKGWLSLPESPEAEGALSFSDTSTEGALSLDTKSKKKTEKSS